jgi:hypothetical protein
VHICIGPEQQLAELRPEATPGRVERPWSDSFLPIAARIRQSTPYFFPARL